MMASLKVYLKIHAINISKFWTCALYVYAWEIIWESLERLKIRGVNVNSMIIDFSILKLALNYY
jgi:hypothetical protein